jgi:hypothetical protein
VDGGAHQRASAGGDGRSGGVPLSCAQANAREEGVCGARRRGASHGPTGWPAEAHAARCCRGTVTGPALGRGATGSGVGEGAGMHRVPTASAYGRKYVGRVGNVEAHRRRDVTTRARGRARRFRVALFNRLKQ